MSKTPKTETDDADATQNQGKLVVASQVRALIRAQDMQVSNDFIDALSSKVEQLVKTAILRAQANQRKTLRPSDI